MDKTLKRGSITMTESYVVIAFSKEKSEAMPLRRVGYDLNEKSIVGSDGTTYDLSEVARLHTLYGIRVLHASGNAGESVLGAGQIVGVTERSYRAGQRDGGFATS